VRWKSGKLVCGRHCQWLAGVSGKSFFMLPSRPDWFAGDGDDEEGTSGVTCNAGMSYYTRTPKCTSVPLNNYHFLAYVETRRKGRDCNKLLPGCTRSSSGD